MPITSSTTPSSQFWHIPWLQSDVIDRNLNVTLPLPSIASGRISAAAISLTEQLRTFPYLPWILFHDGCIRSLVQIICRPLLMQVSDDQHPHAIRVTILESSAPIICIPWVLEHPVYQKPRSINLAPTGLQSRSSISPPQHLPSPGLEKFLFLALSNVCNILCHDVPFVSKCLHTLQLFCLYRRAQHSSSHR